MSESASAIEGHNKRILEIKKLLKERDEARTGGNYSRSDTIRDKLLKDYSIKIMDQANGPSGFKFLDGSSNKLKSSSATEVVSSAKKRSRDEQPPEERRSDGEEPRKKVKTASQEMSRNSSLVASLIGASSGSGRVVQGVTIEDITVGTGKQAKSGSRVRVNYVGKFKTNGRVFDSSTKKPFAFRLGAGEVIRGWDIGCDGMLVGGKRKLIIPPEKAYGKSGAPPTIPPNSTLVFEVTLLDVK